MVPGSPDELFYTIGSWHSNIEFQMKGKTSRVTKKDVKQTYVRAIIVVRIHFASDLPRLIPKQLLSGNGD